MRSVRLSPSLVLRLFMLIAIAFASAGVARARPASEVTTATQVQPLVEVHQLGPVRLERLGPAFIDGAGLFVLARAGDWRLSNEHLSLTFASVDDAAPTVSLPVGGPRHDWTIDDRKPGALLDFAVDGRILDPLGYFTQGVGLDPQDPLIEYRHAEAIGNETTGELGLRLTGPVIESQGVYLRTTWWLGPSRRTVRLESELVRPETPEERRAAQAAAGAELASLAALRAESSFTPMAGQPVSEDLLNDLVDVSAWRRGWASVEDLGYLHTLQDRPTTWSEFYLADMAGIGVACMPARGEVLTASEVFGPVLRSGLRPRPVERESAVERPAPDAGADVWIRWLTFSAGSGADALGVLLSEQGLATARLRGRVQTADGEPVEGAWVRFYRGYLERTRLTGEAPQGFAWDVTDADGYYDVLLPPGRYGMNAQIETRREGRLIPSAVSKLEAGEFRERNMRTYERTGVRVRALDAATSRPIAARLRIEPIPDTPMPVLGPTDSARGYLNYAYIPPEGATIHLQAGYYAFLLTHGITHNQAETSLEIRPGEIADLEAVLEPASPTPGWVHLELGQRTVATPGCVITPGDAVLMAAGEGIDWLVSGDLNTLTDLGPTIREMGLEDRLRAGIGFRTYLPRRPEWGHFLIWPVAADAPDPAVAGERWRDLTRSQDFFAVLRELYPGALIQVDAPYNDDSAMGYFSEPGKTRHEIAWQPKAELDLSFDAVTAFPEWLPVAYAERYEFWMTMLTRGQQAIPAVSSSGRAIVGAEPGYPRMLVDFAGSPRDAWTEEALLQALRANRLQISTGPFITMKINNRDWGGVVPLAARPNFKLRATAPNWVDVRRLSLEKDGVFQNTRITTTDPSQAQRFPDPASGDEWLSIPFPSLDFRDWKDTLVSSRISGALFEANVVSRHPHKPRPFVMTDVTVIDHDADGSYDRLERYADRAR